MAGDDGRALGHPAVVGGKDLQVHTIAHELVTDAHPGVTGFGLGDPDPQQRQPAQLSAGADGVLSLRTTDAA
ncbi:hypothetical protein [Rhodococcus jostii]